MNTPNTTVPELPKLTTTESDNLSLLEQCSGIGFEDDSLSYLPFSAGFRACPAIPFTTTTLPTILTTILTQYSLDCVKTSTDIGKL